MGWLAELHRYEVFLIIQTLIVGVMVIICLVFIRKLFRRRSYVYIVLVSDNHICSIKLMQLPDATRDFCIKVPRKKTTFRTHICGFVGVIVFATAPWKIVRGRDGKVFKCPSWVLISGRQARLVRALLLDTNHWCKPLVVHSHQYESGALTVQKDNPALEATAPPICTIGGNSSSVCV